MPTLREDGGKFCHLCQQSSSQKNLHLQIGHEKKTLQLHRQHLERHIHEILRVFTVEKPYRFRQLVRETQALTNLIDSWKIQI